MTVTEGLAKFASAVTMLKSGLMTLTFLLLAVFFVIWIVKRKKK
jgi:hypothetical protein